jgi:ABC-2 type transport system ATP-binding protein
MTLISLEAAAVGSGLAAELAPITLSIAAGTPVVVPVETDERPMILSLVIGGRLPVTSGRVLIDGRVDAAHLRRSVALVDTPFASEPSPGIPLALVVAEELSFAGRPSGRRAVRAFLDSHELTDFAHVAMRALPATARVLLLSELAALRPGVQCLVITAPERHGGDSRGWYSALEAVASRGVAVAVITDSATSALLFELGARNATEPSETPSPVETLS